MSAPQTDSGNSPPAAITAAKTFRPFIPIWLDTAGLPPTDFRVLAHLWRAAGKRGFCWPAAPKIARVCEVNLKTVWAALGRLEKAGFLKREKHHRNANQYRLLIPSIDPNETPIQPTGAANESTQTEPRLNQPDSAFESTQTERPIDPNEAPPVDPKGAPPRCINEGKKGSVCVEGTPEHTPTPAWPLAFSPEAENGIASRQGLSVARLRQMYSEFRKIKATYLHQDGPPTSEANALDQFEGWVSTHQPKANSRAYSQHADYDGFTGSGSRMPSSVPAPVPAPEDTEPAAWRDAVRGHEDFKWFANRPWLEIPVFYRTQILKLPALARP
jgi:hypothetical protein